MSTLVLLAAGMATRYGSMKQSEGFGPHGELLMDYSIADAVTAGFSRIVMVIKEEYQQLFDELLSAHVMRADFELLYAYQKEPHGTADAVRSAASVVDSPFAVINSDDYYGGSDVYVAALGFLNSLNSEAPPRYGLLGYPLCDTLSDYGQVARGICDVDENYRLNSLVEWFQIHSDHDGAVFGSDAGGKKQQLDSKAICSMNFFMLPPTFMTEIEKDYEDYLAKPRQPGRAGEFLLSTQIDAHRNSGRADVVVLPLTKADWCGVTVSEDAPEVRKKLARLHEEGRYSRLRR